jgi:hypothetical protein
MSANLSDPPSAAGAPPPDIAATSATGSAADSSAAPSPDASVAAPSVDSGADASPDTLDSLYEKFSKQSREEVAAQGEPEKPQQSQEAEEEPAPEPEPDPAEQEAAPAGGDDPLAEFDAPKIPTREEINAQNPRAPKAIRDLAGDLAEKLTAREEDYAAIGGDEGAPIAKAIMPHVLAAQPTPEAVDAVFNALTEANTPLVREMAGTLINVALNDPQTGEEFGNQLLEGEFGKGYNAEVVGKLVEAHKAGLIDLENLEEDQEFGRTPTTRERQLEEKLAAEKQRAEAAEKRLKGSEGERTEATRRAEQQLNDTVDDFITEQAMDEVLPIATKLGWVAGDGDEGPLAAAKVLHGKMVTAYIEAEVKSSPEYATIQALKEAGNAFRGGRPTLQMRQAVASLRTRAKATMMQAGRTLAPTYAKSFTKSPTAKQPPTAVTGANAQNDPPPQRAAGPKTTASPKSTDEVLEELYQKFSGHANDAQVKVGQR